MLIPPKISLLYTGVIAFLYLLMSANVIRWRFSEGRSLGQKDDSESPLFRSIRAHANFAEYVPLTLILLILDEITGRSSTSLHALGSALGAARVLHFYGLSSSSKPNPFRASGSAINFAVIGILAILLIVKAVA